ncbi:alpha/beta hydrolase-fold protein [Paracoccus siganidrum]|uniref:Esterase family protein n=1 Tax=Paracoccus siganidrum TaxID=1276757 RepID=A0A418ZUT2_9RHOB|nr:alpha/beta hydrolase-fold protein [Paracoccus siganidrum]RJL02880.1 esterase family protein [Paracoccus siganidrum]RMC25698.1 hypothetical protein C9E82_22955 [Paracoccus siganidrum]
MKVKTTVFVSALLAMGGMFTPANAQIVYMPPPEAELQVGVMPGKLESFMLPPGKYYPGTPHNYVVYTPAGYDNSKPLPVMIFLDGVRTFLDPKLETNVILDNLIAANEIPPLVAVFVDPGVHPTRSSDGQNRYERHFEYDSISDRYSGFLLDELLLAVSKRYPLSENPNDRAIAGSSTGAVGAFSAAWNRSDQFRRVMSFNGTYISMKGAHTLANIVRKTEPRPIRVFMQAGKADHITDLQPFGTRYAGSWPTANQAMHEALQFAGYDVKFEYGVAGHESTHGRAVMPDALRWLWRDYPEPIKVISLPFYYGQPGSEDRGHVFSVINGDETWEQVGTDYGTISSIASDMDGNVHFNDDSGNIWRLSVEDDSITMLADEQGKNLSMAIGANGRLYVAQPEKKLIVSYGATVADREIVADNVSASAVTSNKQGDIYAVESAQGVILRIDTRGKISTAYDGTDLHEPSSISMSPDQEFMIVGDAKSKFAWSFHVMADGGLVDGEPYYRLEMPEVGLYSENRSVTVNDLGQPFFATPLGIQGFEAAGRQGPILNSPIYGTVSAVSFAGGSKDWLYAAVDGKLFRRSVKSKAVNAGTITKPPAPPL